ncbi:alpha/beta hydrolase [Paucibacter sp. PLA-PC-4]|uniref:alpha/beta hydrolase n=1 Tax=Paucibacter sp. PLA-PC-4 TaxID=2993655 RepID=UPI0022495988|nr:alpha/beta hydrolase [Paucibacter sp. PLA-PC-4]MCX2860809.1 alpha/beta hydrolase [Paucibacter sp. PLA-PC-4]
MGRKGQHGLAALLLTLALDGAAAPSAFVAQALPLASDVGDSLMALRRGALQEPARYRVVVVPGSGCSGLAELADRMFAGLRRAHVLLLHKPRVQLDAGASPKRCMPGFAEADDLGQWLADARSALLAHEASAPPAVRALPLLLLGISEGGELVPFLADVLPQARAIVLIGAAGLDPLEAGTMQAERLGELAQWQLLAEVQASQRPDQLMVDGRSLRYWRSLWRWRSQDALLTSPLELVQAWGDADASLPTAAYELFARRARERRASGFCSLRLRGADHGLQREDYDGLQLIWAGFERWAVDPGRTVCAALRAPATDAQR